MTANPAQRNGEEPPGFEELAIPLLGSLYNFAQWLTRNREDAEDLVQETFAKALRGFPSFQPGTSIKAWMFRILKNSFLTSRAGLKAHPMVELVEGGEGDQGADETPESVLLARASRELVREAIEALPRPFQEPVILRDVEGLTYKEIADALSIPIGTVMSRLARGRRDIRRHIERKRGGS